MFGLMTANSACNSSDASRMSSRTSSKSGAASGSSDISPSIAEIATGFVSEKTSIPSFYFPPP